MFRGSSFHTIDPKGRLIIPARFRDAIRSKGGALVLSVMDGSVVGYTPDEWSQMEQSIVDLPERDEDVRLFRRVFIGNATDCSLDKQSRILIPPVLRDYADLKKEIVLVGVIDHFEIWSRDSWNDQNSRLSDHMKTRTFQEKMAKLRL